jgi:hypothetical protein
MKRLAAPLAGGLFLLLAALGIGAPLQPIDPQRFELPPYSTKRIIETAFKGNQRSVVIASGNGSSMITLYVYDQHGNCVAKDDTCHPRVRDDVAVEWFPPTTAPYVVELRNVGGLPNPVQMAIR